LSIYYFIIPLQLYASEGPENKENSTPDERIIIVISDTQDPLWVEELFLSSDNNETARNILFNHIIDSQPDAVFHLGDLVSIGFYDKSWFAIDQFLTNLSKSQIPFYPTLGNHELMFFSDAGESNFKTRFPFYSKTGYLKRVQSLAFILLNSNFSDLTDEEIVIQQKWYKDQLISCDKDSSIKAIIVACHHPPFTNSKIVHSDKDVQKYFVPDFLLSDKTKFFLSGHAHSFEHFSQAEKDFFNIGGGGGLQHPLYEGQEAVYKDHYKGDKNKRIFHYLTCHINKSRMVIQIKMLSPDHLNINTAYEKKYNFQDHLIVKKR